MIHTIEKLMLGSLAAALPRATARRYSWAIFPLHSAALALLPWAPRWMTPKRPGEPSLQRQNNASRPRAFMPHSGALPLRCRPICITGLNDAGADANDDHGARRPLYGSGSRR